MASNEDETGAIDVTDLDVANRCYNDGWYDDGEGTAFCLPDVIAVSSTGGGCRVHLEGGSELEVDEDPVEVSHVVRAWGRARREAERVFTDHDASGVTP